MSRVAVVVLCLSAGSALGETPSTQPASQPVSQPADERERAAPRRWLDLEELGLDIGFDTSIESREVISQSRGLYGFRYRQLNEEWRFEETVGLHAAGSVVNDRVARFDIGVRGGLSQEGFYERRAGPDQRERPHGDVLEYDVRVDFLPAGKISGSAFAAQHDNRIPRRFLSSLDDNMERYGGELLFNDAKLPMRLSWEHTFDQITGKTDGLIDDEDRREDRVEYEATWQISDKHTLRFNYEHDRRKEKYSGTNTRFDTSRNYFTLDHELRFGLDDRSRWGTLVRIQDEAGDLARDTIEVAPSLRLQHTDKFATTYRAQYLRETFERIRAQSWRGDIGASYDFAKGLTGTLNLYALRQNTDERGGGSGGGADSTEWGGNTGFTFSRENKLGRLSANFTYTHTAIRTTDGRRNGLVLLEAVTFRDPRPAYLAHSDVNRLSVVVTDASGAQVFLRGRDYVIVTVGRYTAISRVRTGRIADGDTVLVSYTYRTLNNYELSRDRFDFRIQQDFKFGLTPYYAASIQDEDLDRSRFRTFGARNVNRHRLGVTYRRPRWSVGVEYEYNDDTIDPFEALHANGDLILIDSARQQLTGRASASRFLFDGSGSLRSHDATLVDAGLSYRYLLARDLELNAAADYRWEDDSLFGITKGVDVTGSLAYQIGLFSVLFEVEYDLLDLPTSYDESVAVWLKLRREIPIIARRER